MLVTQFKIILIFLKNSKHFVEHVFFCCHNTFNLKPKSPKFEVLNFSIFFSQKYFITFKNANILTIYLITILKFLLKKKTNKCHEYQFV